MKKLVMIPPVKEKVFIHFYDGRRLEFDSKAAALKAYGKSWARRNIASYFMAGPPVLAITNIYNEAVSFDRALKKRVQPSYYAGYPVPRTGRLRYGHYYRRPRTLKSKRLAYVGEEYLEEYGQAVLPRARQNASNIPDAWDDIKKFSDKNNNWKRYRKTQWGNFERVDKRERNES